MTQQPFDLHELFQHVLLEAHAAWRYRWHALIVAWCVAIVGALLVFSLPNQYEASAQVYADTASLKNPLLQGIAVQPNVRERLQILTHTLLSRPNLEKVANETGLSLRTTTPTGKAELLDGLGTSVKIQNAGARNLYNISYSDTDRHMAQKVVQSFLQILMNRTLGENTSSNVTAQHFLQQQVASYGQRLNNAEKKLASFKNAHVGYVPGEGSDGFPARLQGAETQLQTLQGEYDTALSQRATIQQQMHAMASSPDSSGIDPRIGQINSQIASYQQKLDQLLLRYTAAYPDVISTKRMIKQLKARRKTLLGSTTDSVSLAALSTDNPVFQARQKYLYMTQVNLRTLATQIGLQKQLIAGLKGKVAKTTDVGATMQQLSRNYETTKKQYNELVARLNTAEITQAATQSGNNLKFRVVNPPVAPLLPTSPKRGLLLVVVFVFAVIIGGVFAYFMHKIKPVFMSLRSLRSFSDYPVIGTFHLIESGVRRVRKRHEIVGFCTGVGCLAVVLALGFAYSGTLASMVQHVFVMGVT